MKRIIQIAATAILMAATSNLYHPWALNNVTVPHAWAPRDTITASRLDAMQDTIYGRMNQLNDTLENRYVRWGEIKDSTLQKVKCDTIRSNPDVDSIQGNPRIDTLTVTTRITTRSIAPDSIVGSPIIDSLSVLTNMAVDSIYCEHGINAELLRADSITVPVMTGNTISRGLISADSFFVTRGYRGVRLSADSVMATKIGIGGSATSPTYPLKIGASGINVLAAGGNDRYQINITDGTRNRYIGIDTVANLAHDLVGGTTGGFTWKTHNGTGFDERMRIHTNGMVGIGSSAPGYPLTITKTGVDVLETGTDRYQLSVGDGSRSRYIGMDNIRNLAYDLIGGANSSWRLYTHNGSAYGERIKVDTNGVTTIAASLTVGTNLSVDSGYSTKAWKAPRIYADSGTVPILRSATTVRGRITADSGTIPIFTNADILMRGNLSIGETGQFTADTIDINTALIDGSGKIDFSSGSTVITGTNVTMDSVVNVSGYTKNGVGVFLSKTYSLADSQSVQITNTAIGVGYYFIRCTEEPDVRGFGAYGVNTFVTDSANFQLDSTADGSVDLYLSGGYYRIRNMLGAVKTILVTLIGF